MLAACLKGKTHDEWDMYVSQLTHAYNTATHSSLGVSPFYFLHGWDPRASGKDYDPQEIGSQSPWLDRIGKIDELRHRVELKMKDAQNKQAARYNLRVNPEVPQFKCGDRVYYPNRKLSNKLAKYSAKLAPKFLPGKINSVISPLVVTLENDNGKILGKYPVSDLKVPRTSPRDRKVTPQ